MVLEKNPVKTRIAKIKRKTPGNEREHVKIHCRMKGKERGSFLVERERNE